MDVIAYPNASAWLADVEPTLLAAEAENNLPLGLAGSAVENPQAFQQGFHSWAIRQDGKLVGAALITPPHNLVICRQTTEALVALAQALDKSNLTLPGVVGPDDTAEQFARIWGTQTGSTHRTRMRQRISACSQVLWSRRAAGIFRAAAEQDAEVLASWFSAFWEEVGAGQTTDSAAAVRQAIAFDRLFVWTLNDELVSCAALTRPTRHGIAVSYVYTPPEHRAHGYATSCVADLTERALQRGRQFCCLYTDLANPISNAIYERIGYRRVCDSQWREFADE